MLFPTQIQLDTVHLSGNLRSGTAPIGQLDVSVKGHSSAGLERDIQCSTAALSIQDSVAYILTEHSQCSYGKTHIKHIFAWRPVQEVVRLLYVRSGHLGCCRSNLSL